MKLSVLNGFIVAEADETECAVYTCCVLDMLQKLQEQNKKEELPKDVNEITVFLNTVLGEKKEQESDQEE